MKKTMHVIVPAICFVFVFGSSVMAGWGNSDRPGKGGERAGGCSLVAGSTPEAISGTVAGQPAGDGLKVDDGNGITTLYGLGPVWFWSSIGVDRPAKGDRIEVDTRRIRLSDGSEQLAMMRIRFNGNDVQLRDPQTGRPLWR